MSRTINIQLVNRSGLTLTFGNATSSEGPVATANMSSVANGGTITVTAYNDSTFNGGNKGTFTLTSGNVQFLIFYTHPQLSGSTYVQVQQQTTGYVSGVSQQTYTGDPVTAYVNLYQGVAVTAPNAATGYAVPLATNPYNQTNNCQDFANAMFGPNMRSEALVQAAYSQTGTPYAPADFSGGQMHTLMQTLLNVWMGVPNIGTSTDVALIGFLKGVFGPVGSYPALNLIVPNIAYVAGSNPSSYVLHNYTSYPFMGTQGANPVWDQGTVQKFLTLLLGGAHFVQIGADQDYQNMGIANPGRDLYSAFRNSGLTQRGDLGNSHYCDTAPINTTGEYYLDIEQDFAPAGSGIVLSLLFGRTVNSLTSTVGTYNTFMQLEGWPAHGLTGGNWHMADYDAYKESLWNISTYGACPYSEKRGTTVFLAPPDFRALNYQTTLMMPYVGAYATGTAPNGSPQSWLDTSVVSVPSNASTLPPKYYD